MDLAPVEIAVESDPGALLTLADAGPGVPVEQCERIFQPFHRGPGATTHASGSGVDLAQWVQVAALLPTRQVHHPLGCYRRRIPDRISFDKLVQILVFCCGYRRIADATCSATTLRRRRDEWITSALPNGSGWRCLAPMTGCSGWNWSTWWWMGASPRRPAAARPPAQARWTVTSKG